MITPATNSTDDTMIRARFSWLTPTTNSTTAATTSTNDSPSTGQPFRSRADRSVTFGLGISTITSTSAVIIQLLRDSMSRR